MITAHNIPLYKLIHALYDMQSKGYVYADIRIEDDLNVILKPSELNFKNKHEDSPETGLDDIDLTELI